MQENLREGPTLPVQAGIVRLKHSSVWDECGEKHASILPRRMQSLERALLRVTRILVESEFKPKSI